VIVIKLGGAALKATLEDPRLFEVLAKAPQELVIVHGGGPEINKLCEQLGLKFEFVGGQRVTSPEVMTVVEMALTGRINPALVRGMLRAGRKAAGLSGVSGGMLMCSEENPQLGLVGRVAKVDASLVRAALKEGLTPIVSPVGLLPGFNPCNVNADLATAALASELKAERLLFLTDKDGILDAEGGTIRALDVKTLEALTASDVVSGGMKVKARAILETLRANPNCSVEVMNGLEPEVLRVALDGKGRGTRVSN